MNDCLTDWLTDWLSDQSVGWRIEGLIDWMIVIDQLMLIDCLKMESLPRHIMCNTHDAPPPPAPGGGGGSSFRKYSNPKWKWVHYSEGSSIREWKRVHVYVPTIFVSEYGA